LASLLTGLETSVRLGSNFQRSDGTCVLLLLSLRRINSGGERLSIAGPDVAHDVWCTSLQILLAFVPEIWMSSGVWIRPIDLLTSVFPTRDLLRHLQFDV